jgi:hypothetical protein
VEGVRGLSADVLVSTLTLVGVVVGLFGGYLWAAGGRGSSGFTSNAPW